MYEVYETEPYDEIRFGELTAELGNAVLAVQQARTAEREATERLHGWLSERIGDSLLLAGYVDMAGVPTARGWTYLPVGPLGCSLEDKALRPGQYTVVSVPEREHTLYFSPTGFETVRRYKTPLRWIRPATAEELAPVPLALPADSADQSHPEE